MTEKMGTEVPNLSPAPPSVTGEERAGRRYATTAKPRPADGKMSSCELACKLQDQSASNWPRDDDVAMSEAPALADHNNTHSTPTSPQSESAPPHSAEVAQPSQHSHLPPLPLQTPPSPSSSLPCSSSTPGSTSPSNLLPLPTSCPFYGHLKIIIGDGYHTFPSHECSDIYKCPLIPEGKPQESRDTATRNHRSRHAIAKNWGIQLETLLSRVANKMVLPPKYAKHLLSSLAALSSKMQDPAVALELLVQTYCEHRVNNDMNAPFRVQDVKNTLEVLEKQSGRVSETRNTGNEGSRNCDNVSSPELQSLSTPTPNSRPRGSRTVQFVNPDTNSMPPPPTPPAKRARRNLAPAVSDAGKSPPLDAPETEKRGEFVVPPVPTHNKFTRATVSKDKGKDSEAGNASLYFLPADPEPPRKKRSNGGSRAAKPVLPVTAMINPGLEFGGTGTIDGVRTWKGRKIWPSDIVDIAAEYYQWHMGSIDEYRQKFEGKRKGVLQIDVKGTSGKLGDEDPGCNVPKPNTEMQNKGGVHEDEATEITNISDEVLSSVPKTTSTPAETHETSNPDDDPSPSTSRSGSISSLKPVPPPLPAEAQVADMPARTLESPLETKPPILGVVELSPQAIQSNNLRAPNSHTASEMATFPVGNLPPVHVPEAYKNKSSEIGGYVANMLGLAAMKFPDVVQSQESDERPLIPRQVSFPPSTAVTSTTDSATA